MAPGLVSTNVLGRLYEAGFLVSRDRLAVFADMLWPNGELRPNVRTPRRFNDEQVEYLRCAFELHDRFRVPTEEIATSVQARGLAAGLLAAAEDLRDRASTLCDALEGLDLGEEQLSA